MRKISLIFVAAAVVLALLIYVDSTDNETGKSEITQPVSPKSELTQLYEQPEALISKMETFSDVHSSVDLTNRDAVMARVQEIELEFEAGLTGREAIPFYGELMLLYMQVNREDAAAEASRHIAMMLNDADDWWNAAVLFYRWGLKQQTEELFFYYLGRSDQAFAEATTLVSNPEMLTDHAIVLQAIGKTEEALSQLERARNANNPSFRPFLYSGLILHETGLKDESISYISKSLELATRGEEQQLIRSIIAESSIEIEIEI